MWTSLREKIQTVWQAVTGIALEISDQSAYQRHLRTIGVSHSAEEWRRFSDARLQAKFVRPKCC